MTFRSRSDVEVLRREQIDHLCEAHGQTFTDLVDEQPGDLFHLHLSLHSETGSPA